MATSSKNVDFEKTHTHKSGSHYETIIPIHKIY